jgi:competence protein ComEA
VHEHTIVVQPLPLDATIVVDVRGGVATPGIRHLPGDARVADAVAAAGGLTADADVTRMNLAARLADGQRLTIPMGGRPVDAGTDPAVFSSADATPMSQSAHAEPTSTPAVKLVNLNTASAAELKSLPGIGDVLAGRIVDYREANGPFRTVDQLREVRGVSAKLIEKLRPLVTVDG